MASQRGERARGGTSLSSLIFSDEVGGDAIVIAGLVEQLCAVRRVGWE